MRDSVNTTKRQRVRETEKAREFYEQMRSDGLTIPGAREQMQLARRLT